MLVVDSVDVDSVGADTVREDIVRADNVGAALDTTDDVVLILNVPTWYSSRRLPAPQYSYGLPGQMKEQSVNGACTEPVFRVLPQ